MIKQLIIFTLLSCLISTAQASDKTLNVYQWAGYLPQSILKQFEAETGIQVNLSEFDSNETLYTKLKTTPDAGYDIIGPSSYYVQRMRDENMLKKLDKKRLPNLGFIEPSLLNQSFDPNNRYSVPFLWGTTGIVIDKKYHPKDKIRYWKDLWKPEYKDSLLILDDPREAFGIALKSLGYSINDKNPKHIKQAFLKLKALIKNIKLFSSDAEQSIYIDEDVTIGMGWNGDIYRAQQENKSLMFIYPMEGFSIWLDCLAIAKNAPHLANAYRFINFLMRPDIAKKISLSTGYTSPNKAAIQLLPQDMKKNPILNPSPSVLKRGEFQNDVGSAKKIYDTYWERLKIGD